MNDHDLEQLIRRSLTDLAEDAPTRLPSQGRSTVRRRGVMRLVGAGLVLASAVVGGVVLTTGGDPSEPPSSAVCPKVFDYQGERYSAGGDVKRMPSSGERLPGIARTPRCDDGFGANPSREIRVYSLPGASPRSAVIADGEIWTNTTLSELPGPVIAARSPVTCELTTRTAVVGSVWALNGAGTPRFDGDVRGPFTLEMRSADPLVTGPGYQWVTLRARGAAAAAPSRSVAAAVLYDGEPAVVDLSCDAQRFVVLGIRLAG